MYICFHYCGQWYFPSQLVGTRQDGWWYTTKHKQMDSSTLSTARNQITACRSFHLYRLHAADITVI